MRIIILLLTFVFAGCTTPTANYYSLKLEPLQNTDPNSNTSNGIKLNDEQRLALEKKAKTFKRLIRLLDEFEKEIKQKQATAEAFSFALSKDNLLSLDASKLLLQYLNEARENAKANIIAFEKLLH